jgi:peptidoglycan/xylan/chitin deacetylase (PgdA/CDA1 family)
MNSERTIPVLVWHKVSPRGEPGITVVSPERFRRQLAALRAAGAGPITLEEYQTRGGRQRTGGTHCLLCFDDAYACVEEHAAPQLLKLGWPATLFPVLGWIGRENGWDRGLLGRRFAHLDVDGIRRLLEAGWSLGLHGRSHRPLVGRGLDVLERELVESRAELELLFGRSVHAIAWPYGRCDRRAVRVAQAAGLRLGFGRCQPEHPLCRSRLMVYPLHGEAALRAMLAGAPPDALQRLAGLGARLSSWLGGRDAPQLV